MNETTTYRVLLSKMESVKKNLKAINFWKESARFDLNIKLLSGLTLAFENGEVINFVKKNNKKGECLFMLKEVKEFVDAFEILLPRIKKLDRESLKILENNIKYILSGPQFTYEENFDNSRARDYLFEITTASQFIKLGANIQFRLHPDVILNTTNNEYMVECKRVLFGINYLKRLERLAIEACSQLHNSKKSTGIKMGIISLDLSSLFEQGRFILKAEDEDKVYIKTQKDMQKVQKFLLDNKIIQNYATRGLLTGCILNISVVTDVKNKLGWASQKSILAFSKENPNRAKKFLRDFYKETVADSIDKELIN